MILGIGMTGPQRTGKTTFAKQLSLVNNIKFIELNTGRSIQQAGVDPKQEVDIDTRLSLQRMLLTNFADTLRHNTAPFLTDRTPIDYASYMLADITRTVQVDEVLNFVDLCVEYTKRHYHKIFLFGPSPITNVEVDTSASINKAFMLHYYHICRSLLSETGVKVIPVNKNV